MAPGYWMRNARGMVWSSCVVVRSEDGTKSKALSRQRARPDARTPVSRRSAKQIVGRRNIPTSGYSLRPATGAALWGTQAIRTPEVQPRTVTNPASSRFNPSGSFPSRPREISSLSKVRPGPFQRRRTSLLGYKTKSGGEATGSDWHHGCNCPPHTSGLGLCGRRRQIAASEIRFCRVAKPGAATAPQTFPAAASK